MAIALQAKGLTKEFKGFVAVNDVDLSIEKGSIHALIGPNGAGKTTCFNLLTKFLQPTRGTITYEGRDITRMKPTDIARLGMVRSFQISAIFPDLTVLQNVRVALQRMRGESYDFWRSDKILSKLDDQAQAHLDEVGLTGFTNERAAALPYGRKRALEIATTLALAPDMLLLDEPMAGMGREDVELISQLIRRIAKNRTVLMVEHNLSVVADLSDRITVLARGEIWPRAATRRFPRPPKWSRHISERAMSDAANVLLKVAVFRAGMAKAMSCTGSISRSTRARSSRCWGATARARHRPCWRSWASCASGPGSVTFKDTEIIGLQPRQIAGWASRSVPRSGASSRR